MRAVLRRLVCSACLACTLASTSTIAYGGDPLALPAAPTARDHLNRGARLYNTRSFDEAIAEFKAGALIEPAPVFYYNLGQAYRQLGKYEEAIWNYERFLANGNPTGEVLAAVQGFVAEMKVHLADRAHSMPPTDAATDAGANSPIGSPTPATQGLSRPAQTKQPDADTNSAGGFAWLGWGLTAAGIVGGGVTTWLAVSASGLDADAKDTTLSTSDRLDLEKRADSRRHSALIIGVSSGAAVVLGVVTLTLVARHGTHPSTTAFSLGFTGSGVAAFGTF